MGKTRLLIETQHEADRHHVMVLKGRAVESGGAYRPLVEAFARASAPLVHERELAAVRLILARVLPGWVSDHDVLAPMADPAAVLAEALILLLGPCPLTGPHCSSMMCTGPTMTPCPCSAIWPTHSTSCRLR